MSRRLVLVVALTVALLAGGTAAMAFLSTTGSGAATAQSSTLISPAPVELAPGGTGEVDVSWAASELVGVTGHNDEIVYRVERTSDEGATWVDAGSGCAGDVAGVTCTDEVPATGTYRYRVAAVFNSWTTVATAADTIDITLGAADQVPPTVTVEQKTSLPAQADPTNELPIRFTAAFSEDVNDFAAEDVHIQGAGSANVSVTGSGQQYTIEVNGPPAIADGTLEASIPAGVAHDAAGNGNEASTSDDNSVVYDTTAPTHSLSLFGSPVGAYLTGSTLFYKGNAAGTFILRDAVSDGLSGAASATFPAIATNGWAHAAETVATPAGGPFNSSAFSWTANPALPAGHTVTALDRAGNAGGTTLNFVNDILAPTGSITVPSNGASITGSAVTVSANASDASSGVASTRFQSRPSGSSTWTDMFTDTSTPYSSAFDSTLFRGDVDTFVRMVVTDNVGNTFTTSDTEYKVKAVNNYPTGLTLANGNGTAQAGDTLSVVFRDAVDASTLCSSWTVNGSTPSNEHDVVVTITENGARDILTVTRSTSVCAGGGNWGTWVIGDHVSATTTFSGGGGNRSQISYLNGNKQLVFTLGTPSNAANIKSGVGSVDVTYAANPDVRSGGQPISQAAHSYGTKRL